MVLGRILRFLAGFVSPASFVLRAAFNPSLGTEAAEVQRDALRVLAGDPSEADMRQLDRRLKRAVLTDLFRISGVPDVAGVGARQLAAEVVPLDPDRSIDTDRLIELATRDRFGLTEAVRQAERDPFLGPLLT